MFQQCGRTCKEKCFWEKYCLSNTFEIRSDWVLEKWNYLKALPTCYGQLFNKPDPSWYTFWKSWKRTNIADGLWRRSRRVTWPDRRIGGRHLGAELWYCAQSVRLKVIKKLPLQTKIWRTLVDAFIHYEGLYRTQRCHLSHKNYEGHGLLSIPRSCRIHKNQALHFVPERRTFMLSADSHGRTTIMRSEQNATESIMWLVCVHDVLLCHSYVSCSYTGRDRL